MDIDYFKRIWSNLPKKSRSKLRKKKFQSKVMKMQKIKQKEKAAKGKRKIEMTQVHKIWKISMILNTSQKDKKNSYKDQKKFLMKTSEKYVDKIKVNQTKNKN